MTYYIENSVIANEAKQSVKEKKHICHTKSTMPNKRNFG